MIIRTAVLNDIDTIAKHDKWIDRETIEKKILENQIYVAHCDNVFVGWLRYGLFWDNVPYMNMLHLLEPYRKQGTGKQMVLHWENEMKSKRYKLLLTSSSQVEYAQHFYTKLGYSAVGCFNLANEPLEIIFSKAI